MDNPNDATTTTATATAPPPAPAPTPPPANNDDDKGDISKLPQAVQDEIKKLRAENRDRRKSEEKTQGEFEAYKAKIKADADAAEAARLEAEGKHKERADLLARQLEEEKGARKTEKAFGAIERAAIAAGLLDPVVAKLIPMDKVSVNDAGEVVGASEAVEAFKAQAPALFNDGSAANVRTTGNTKANPTAQTGNSTTKNVMEMTPAEFAAWEKEQMKDFRSSLQ